MWLSVRAYSAQYWLPGLLIVGATALQLFLVTRSVPFLVTNLLPDDAFYYFQIARHIALGEGSTFDGLNMTNGYHPLWMIVLIPIYAIFSLGGTWDITPISIALAIQVLLNTGTAILLLLLIKNITDNRYAQACALVVWLLNPFLLYETLNGLETALALFLLLVFVHLVLRVEAAPTMRRCLIAGFVGGLLILARLDMAFFVLAFGLWLWARHGFMTAVYAGMVTGLTILPWFAWNLLEFNMLFTSASNGNVFINHALVAADNGPGFLMQLKGSVYLFLYYGKAVLLRSGASWFIFVLLGAAGAYALTRMRSWRDIRVPLIVVLFMGGLALFAVNVGIRFTGRTWYFVSLYVFLALSAAWTLQHIVPDTRRTIVSLGLCVCLLGSFTLAWKEEVHNQFAPQGAMLSMATWMNETLEPGTRVGVFNAGVQGYFSHVRVSNLDGLVNNAAYEAITRSELWSYIQDENILYISDFDLYLTYRYKPFLDTADVFAELEEVHRISVSEELHNIDSIALYRIRNSDN